MWASIAIRIIYFVSWTNKCRLAIKTCVGFLSLSTLNNVFFRFIPLFITHHLVGLSFYGFWPRVHLRIYFFTIEFLESSEKLLSYKELLWTAPPIHRWFCVRQQVCFSNNSFIFSTLRSENVNLPSQPWMELIEVVSCKLSVGQWGSWDSVASVGFKYPR